MKKYLCLFATLAFVSVLLLGCTEKETQVEVSSVSLNTPTIEMVEGETFTLVATVLPKDAEYDGVIWASSNASVASVNSGIVSALKEGTSTITASAGEKSATCSVKVSAKTIAVTSITLDKTSLSMQVGETETITATVKPDDATDKTVAWSSSDESVVKVDNGKVIAINTGQAKITAAVGNIATSCDIVVYQSDNVIIYTTTDKKVLKPYNEAAFSSAIVSNTYIGDVGIITFEKPLTFIGGAAFYYQSKLQSIIIPETVSTIGEKSFQYCTGLLSVKLPQSLTLIKYKAFYWCRSLAALVFPDNVQEIGDEAFAYCYKAFENNTLTLPKKLQTISRMVRKYENIQELTLPKKLQTISRGAFKDCNLLNVIWNENLNYIGSTAFCNNDFEEISIPGNVATIDHHCFETCRLLKKVEFQEGITKVDGYCFLYCVKLSKVILPSTITELGYIFPPML